jgi:hypothetical protein
MLNCKERAARMPVTRLANDSTLQLACDCCKMLVALGSTPLCEAESLSGAEPLTAGSPQLDGANRWLPFLRAAGSQGSEAAACPLLSARYSEYWHSASCPLPAASWFGTDSPRLR